MSAVQNNDRPPAPTPTRLGGAARPLATGLAAIVLLALALASVDTPGALPLSGAAWVASTVAALATAWPRRRCPRATIARGWSDLASWLHTREAVAVLLLALAGGVLRLYDLAGYPTAINNDEAEFALIARQVLAGEGPHPFGTAFLGDSALYFYFLAPFAARFEAGIGGLRLFGALCGTLTLPAFYAFARHLFGARVALLALAILAGSAAHVHFSRLTLNVAPVPLIGCLAFFALARGQQTRRAICWLVGGMLGGFAVYFHFAGRLLPLIVGLYFVCLFVAHRGAWRAWAKGAGLALLGGAWVLAPLGVHLAANPHEFTYHTSARLIFNLWPAVTAAYGTTNAAEVLSRQFALNVLGFVSAPDGSNFFYTFANMPLLVPLLAPFFIAGTGLILRRAKDPRYGLLSVWFGTFIAVGTVTNDPPQAHRLVNALPVAALAVALALDWCLVMATGRSARALASALLLLPLVAAVVDNANYFGPAANNDPWQETTALGEFAAALGPGYYVYALTPPYFSYDHGNRRFLAPDTRGETLRNPAVELPVRPPEGLDIAFVVYPQIEEHLARLAELYPGGREEVVRDRMGRKLFTAILLEGAMLSQEGQARQ